MENLSLIKSTKLKTLNQLYKELFYGGKSVRACLVQDISASLHIGKDETHLLKSSVEGIHHSSILHDDVIDSSLLRRGRKAIWIQFSRNKAILAGDYLLAEVSFKISEHGNLSLLKLTSSVIKKMVQGEWMQSEKKGFENLKILDQIHIFKTASLFEWCLKAPFLCIRREEKSLHILLEAIGRDFGKLFQRSDDLIDFDLRNRENKSVFKDLKEGYLNFFGIYLIQNSNVKKEDLLLCRNKKDLLNLCSEKNLKKIIFEFDKMNKKVIKNCKKNIIRLSPYLDSSQKELICTLNSWVEKLYLRM